MELIKIQKSKFSQKDVNTVNARDLHKFLEIGKDFSTWVKDRLEGFIEGEDYLFTKIGEQLPSGKKYKIEYFITIDTAKNIAMMERNKKGHEVRKYFIEVEKQATQNNTENFFASLNITKHIDEKTQKNNSKMINGIKFENEKNSFRRLEIIQEYPELATQNNFENETEEFVKIKMLEQNKELANEKNFNKEWNQWVKEEMVYQNKNLANEENYNKELSSDIRRAFIQQNSSLANQENFDKEEGFKVKDIMLMKNKKLANEKNFKKEGNKWIKHQMIRINPSLEN